MDKQKKRRSNDARLQAMENRMKERKINESTISGSLKCNSNSNSKHITFDSDSDDNAVKAKDIFSENPLELIDETETYRLPDKPQFEGNSGAELFKLQQRTRNDDRFRLDERFVDSNSEVEVEEKKNNFVEEKHKYFKILGEVLGKNIHAEKRHRRRVEHVIRFDPTLESHKKYLVERRETPSPERRALSGQDTSKQSYSETDGIPKVSKETYFEYNNETSIASLFGNTNTGAGKESGMFNFEIQPTERIELAKPYTFENMEETGASHLVNTEHHFVTNCDSSKQNNGNKEASDSEPQNLFFFHTTNAKLRNRIDQINFCRQKDLETLNREWREKAASLMQDCKRKHRDAIRWKNKSLSLK